MSQELLPLIKTTTTTSSSSILLIHNELMCTTCHQRIVVGKRLFCSRCLNRIYCSHACQKKDWKAEHRWTCHRYSVSHSLRQTGLQWFQSLHESARMTSFAKKAQVNFTECVNYMTDQDGETLQHLMQIARHQSGDDIPLLGWRYLPSKSYRFFSVSQHKSHRMILQSILHQNPTFFDCNRTRVVFFHLRPFPDSLFHPLCPFGQLALAEISIVNASTPLSPSTATMRIYSAYLIVRPRLMGTPTIFYLFQWL